MRKHGSSYLVIVFKGRLVFGGAGRWQLKICRAFHYAKKLKQRQSVINKNHSVEYCGSFRDFSKISSSCFSKQFRKSDSASRFTPLICKTVHLEKEVLDKILIQTSSFSRKLYLLELCGYKQHGEQFFQRPTLTVASLVKLKC